jgi:quinol monooxygenase YgiN
VIIIAGRAEADPVRLADLKGALQAMMKATWEESGCLSYSLAIEHEGGADGPAVISIMERWESEASLQSHFNSAHMKAFNAAVEGAMLSVDVKIYDVVNERPLQL